MRFTVVENRFYIECFEYLKKYLNGSSYFYHWNQHLKSTITPIALAGDIMAAKFLTIEIISQLIVINERCGRAPAANTWRHEAAVPTTKRTKRRCTHGLRVTYHWIWYWKWIEFGDWVLFITFLILKGSLLSFIINCIIFFYFVVFCHVLLQVFI